MSSSYRGKDQNPSTRYTEKGMFVAGRRSYWIQSKEGHFCSCTRQVLKTKVGWIWIFSQIALLHLILASFCGWVKITEKRISKGKLTLPSLVKADRAKGFWKLMTVKRRCYSSTLFSLFMNASQIQQEFWTYFLCFLSIKTQHSLCVIGWLLTSLSNWINNVQHLSWHAIRNICKWKSSKPIFLI